ncbi:DUF2325 domain-containing protein [Stappia sp. 28M-7]|uniref:DUF2325 domain-containing protein n=1 Tax=Stappia sp. 28M-7 TaxID=2762596 RepID=UPI00163BE960|nr:DUF2325 domain-containing protein [Stappia sp. 28M-7]MBC2857846.1 DUF2325 domain-containing protein [Stappia sp. 28M-7]
MCARDDKLRKAIETAVAAHSGRAPLACEEIGSDAQAARKRIALWEQADSVHCSIVGTCASVADLRRTAKKTGIDVSPDTPDYDVHGHFVRLSTTDCAFSRAFQKLLDGRFEGALRRVGRARTAAELEALWRDMCDRGQVGPAYWAFMTHQHVPGALRARIFGEVHMWSHLAGASFRQKNEEAATLRDQLQEAEDRARRVESGLREALAQRDRELIELRAALAKLKAGRAADEARQPETAETAPDAASLRRRLDKAGRALQSARVRARQAEARLREIDDETRRPAPQLMPRQARPMAGLAASPAPFAVVGSAVGTLPGQGEATARPKAILYVGGMHGHRDRLRGIAEAFNTTFVHHDGGVEDAPQRLDHLLPSVDCVFCPVNCVSHDACLRAKKICQKLNKPFVPLRSTGQTAFRKALQDLVGERSAAQFALQGPVSEEGETA